MIDGTYTIAIDTPFGRKDGTVVLRTEDDVVFADIDAPIIGKRHAKGRAEGDAFTAQGSGKVKLIGKVDYTLKGEVSGDDLCVYIKSNKGDFTLKGIRV